MGRLSASSPPGVRSTFCPMTRGCRVGETTDAPNVVATAEYRLPRPRYLSAFPLPFHNIARCCRSVAHLRATQQRAPWPALAARDDPSPRARIARSMHMAETFTVTLDGAMLRRGFWLYVWEITTPSSNKVLYVGAPGDSSSPKAQSLFNRMGQNLGTWPPAAWCATTLRSGVSDPSSASSAWSGMDRCSTSRRRRRWRRHKPIRDQIAAWRRGLPRTSRRPAMT